MNAGGGLMLNRGLRLALNFAACFIAGRNADGVFLMQFG